MPIVKAVAQTAGRCVVGKHPNRSVVPVDARLAVDAGCEGVAVVADSAANEVAVDVHAHAQCVHGLVVVALLRVAIAVAALALKRVGSCVSTPRFLRETIQALITVDSRCPEKWKKCRMRCSVISKVQIEDVGPTSGKREAIIFYDVSYVIQTLCCYFS